LPLLESSPGFRARAVAADSPGYLSDGKPRRMVCICNNMGFYGPNILPDGGGRGYRPSRYLKVIDDLRDDYTVFSGVAHPEVDGGHAAEKCYLTTAPHPGGNSFKNTISLDQFAAPFVGRETRFPSLVLTANGAQSLSWTRAGVPIPGYTSPAQVFSKLFFNGTRQEVDAQVMRLRQGQSIMDAALAQASALRRSLDAPDREKLDEYLTSVREVEKQMLRQQEWERKPRPKVSAKPPKDIEGEGDVTGRTRLMYDLTRLALETDSTRLITIFVEGFFVVPPMAAATTRAICRRFSQAVDSSTASIWPSTGTIITRSEICMCRCCNGWASRRAVLAPGVEPCAGWRWFNGRVSPGSIVSRSTS
jgi:hypothetical protein